MGPNSRLKLGAISATMAILFVSIPIHGDFEYALTKRDKISRNIKWEFIH